MMWLNKVAMRTADRLLPATVCVLLSWLVLAHPSEINAKETVPDFDREVLPILQENCSPCHAQESPAAGLDLRNGESMMRGGHSGPVVFPGSLESSVLYEKVHSRSMPPPGLGKTLTDVEISVIRRWIESGAAGKFALAPSESPEISEEDRGFWAFRKPVKRPVPEVKDSRRPRTPVDAFILSKLEEKGLQFSLDASKATLLRRAHYDLTGLPPSLEEIQEFMADKSAGAYKRLLDRLLASRHFGERWGRHWLDVAGYTDVGSIDNDLEIVEVKEGMWHYRDYVIRSFNEDKPYDEFLIEQVAGDELVDWREAESYTPEILAKLVATGYLRTVVDTTDPVQLNLPRERHDVITRVVDNLSSGLLGLTVGCARCHAHKYDPIPQHDYYRLKAVFATSYNPDEWLQPKDRFLPDVSKPEQEEIAKHNAEIDRPVAELQKKLEELRRPHEERMFEERLAKVPDELRADVRTASETPGKDRDAVQKYLMRKYGDLLKIEPEEVHAALSEKEREQQTAIQEKIATFEGWRRSYGKIQALWDMGPAPETHLFYRGSFETPGPKVEPGFLQVLSAPGKAKVTSADVRGESSGRRLALAKWLASEENPLTARVMVNRIWQHLFGRGIVAAPENFGRSGIPPTHPELLDWLAADFMQHDWKVKRLLKLIMMSTVYRQSSVRAEEGAASKGESVDPENTLYWRTRLRRADAEVIRDSILAVSGKLDRTAGGPPILLDYSPDGLITIAEGEDQPPDGRGRRSVYVLARRNYPLTLLDNFDYPLMALNCTRRGNSATPIQSLALLNSEFVMEQARSFADRVRELTGPEASPEDGVRTSYLLALSREPTPKEVEFSLEHLGKQTGRYVELHTPSAEAGKQALSHLCQMLIASNEFLYID